MDRERKKYSQRRSKSLPSRFTTRETEDGPYIEGYFAVYNSTCELFPGATESIAPGAFANTLGDDIRALVNHDTSQVLGRTRAGTLELEQDDHGLFGRIKINPNDTDAMNLYNRVQRGDVDQCSIGFDIIQEDTANQDNGGVHWTLREVKLYEVSVVTFPAYEDTSVTARQRDLEDVQRRQKEAWASRLKKQLSGKKVDIQKGGQ